jgi:uncharacterized protein (TIGR02246 family)
MNHKAEITATTQVHAANESLLLAWMQKDLQRIADCYAEDGMLIPPNSPIVQGPEAIRKFAADRSEANVSLRAQGTHVEVSGSGDLAFVRGSYEATLTGPAGEQLNDRGRYLHVWKRQSDGTWKAIVDMWSSELPRPAA